MYKIQCGWGETVAKLLYKQDGIYYWQAKNGFKFITHDLNDTIEL